MKTDFMETLEKSPAGRVWSASTDGGKDSSVEGTARERLVFMEYLVVPLGCRAKGAERCWPDHLDVELLACDRPEAGSK